MNKRVLLVLAMTIAGALWSAGCEDDPHDLDYLKHSAAGAGGGGGQAGTSGTTDAGSKQDAGSDAGGSADAGH